MPGKESAMSPDTCIYFRDADACVCKRLCGMRPNCPYWTAHECAVEGKIGRQGILGNQRAPVVLQPAPTLMRFRA